MNRSLAQWLADNTVGAVLVTALLGLLPLIGIGVAFFLPGAVPALVVLVRGERSGAIIAAGASLLLAGAMLAFGRPVAVGLIYSAWVLGPPLLLALLLSFALALRPLLRSANWRSSGAPQEAR